MLTNEYVYLVYSSLVLSMYREDAEFHNYKVFDAALLFTFLKF